MVRPDHRCTGRMIQHATLNDYSTCGTLRQISGSLLVDDFVLRPAFTTIARRFRFLLTCVMFLLPTPAQNGGGLHRAGSSASLTPRHERPRACPTARHFSVRRGACHVPERITPARTYATPDHRRARLRQPVQPTDLPPRARGQRLCRAGLVGPCRRGAAAHCSPQGIILSGGPNSVYDAGAPTLPDAVIEPAACRCWASATACNCWRTPWAAGSRPAASASMARPGSHHRHARLARSSPLFRRICPPALPVWMSHGDRVERLPDGFLAIAHSGNSPLAAIADEARRLYGLQFHPEVVHTAQGATSWPTSSSGICGCRGDWTAGNFIQETVERIRAQVGPEGHVICGLSGGVDSAVAAALVHRAIGDRLACVFVDHGLLRQGEPEQVDRDLRAPPGHAPDRRRRQGGVPHRSGRRHRPGAQAQAHRRPLRARLRGGGGAPGRRVGRRQRRPSWPRARSIPT